MWAKKEYVDIGAVLICLYILTIFLCFILSLQKLKATVSQPLPQVANEDGEIQSSAVTHTPAPTSPSATPAQGATAALTPAPISHLSKSGEPSPLALQQPATSTTETPVRVSAQDKQYWSKRDNISI